MKKKLKHANMRNAHLKKRTDLQIAKYLISTYLSGTAYELVMAQLVGSVSKRRKRWSKNVKLYCLSLYYKSPTAYRFLRKTFSIPSVRTLQRIFDKFQIDCGFSADMFSVLKKRVSTMSELDKLCNVCIDEMSLKCGLHYNVSKDRVNGFVNMDCGANQEISKQVFMTTGLVSNLKQPIGFFLVKTTASAHVLQTLLSECLTRLFDIGLCVKSVIFYQGASNQKLGKLLDVSVERPFYCHHDNKVFVLFDPPHLLTSVRNNLKNHDFLLDNNVKYRGNILKNGMKLRVQNRTCYV